MALVIDEVRRHRRLVTWKVSWRTLVGEISDEHDDAADEGHAPVTREGDTWIVDGRTPLEDLEAAIGEGVDLAPPDLDEEIDTVAGLVNALAGRVPQRREVVDHPGGFAIEAAHRRSSARRSGSAYAACPPPSPTAEGGIEDGRTSRLGQSLQFSPR